MSAETQEKETVEQEQEQVSEQAKDTPSAQDAVEKADAGADMPTEEPVVGEEEAQIAAEILAGEEPETTKEKETVPVSVVAELREERRANRALIEALQSQFVERAKPPEAPPEWSPLEKYYKDNTELDPNIDAPPGGVLIAERKWLEGQAQKRATEQQAQQRRNLGLKSTQKAKSIHKEDFDDVVEIGSKYLTDGNKLDIYNSDDPAMTLYKLCAKAALESGTSDAATVRQIMKAKLTKIPASKITTKKKETTTKKGETEPEITETGTGMSMELARIYNSFGL